MGGDEAPRAQHSRRFKANAQQVLTVRQSGREQQAPSAQFCQRQTSTMPGAVRLLETESTQNGEATALSARRPRVQKPTPDAQSLTKAHL